jgi:cellulose synthase/poly-beta-1,6-N-acetylglucosamine synthase-like glycosyltransferase
MLILQGVLWAVAAWWACALCNAILNLLLVPRLSKDAPSGNLPSLTVVLPARNEEARVGEAVAAHCAQDYPGLQVVVVDDGSTDRTPEILRELSGRFAGLEVVAGTPPPEGWLGKPNAQRRGLEAARGEYVLFADADVIYAPGTLRRAMGEMVRRDLDMLLLLSRLEGRGLEPLVLSMLDAFAFYASPTFLVNRPRLKGFAFGAGSGNLVRRSALEAAGGIEAIRAEVVDDVAMGRRLKALRGRFRVVLAFREIRVRMYTSFRGCIEGFTKNYYAFFGFSPLRAWFLQLGDGAVHSLPAAALAASLVLPALAPLRLPAAMAFGAGLLLNAGACLWSGHPLWVAPLYPFRPWIWAGILWRSMRRYQREGLIWRGRRYGKN